MKSKNKVQVGKCLLCEKKVVEDKGGYSWIDIHCGFYSDWDLNEFYTYICNSCMAKVLEKKIPHSWAKYIPFSEPFSLRPFKEYLKFRKQLEKRKK